MSRSHARLGVTGSDAGTRLLRATANAPQRWTVSRRAADGWLEATHQLLGDGVFGGDTHRTIISASPFARLIVRAVAATPLRGPQASATLTHLRAESGAALLYLPGALIPQTGSNHSSSISMTAAEGAQIVAASIVVPGRSGMGERGEFDSLRIRTTARLAAELAFAEDALIAPAELAIDGPAVFAGWGASLSIIAVGDGPTALPAWWGPLCQVEGVLGGVTPLRTGGVAFRALCANLGAAQSATKLLERRLRQT